MPPGFTSGTCAAELSVTVIGNWAPRIFPFEVANALTWTVTVVGWVLFGCQVRVHLPLPECCISNPDSPVLKLTFTLAGYLSVTAFPQSSAKCNSRLTGCPRGTCETADAGFVSCDRSSDVCSSDQIG